MSTESKASKESRGTGRKRGRLVWLGVWFGILMVLSVARSLDKGINHDEHQFVVPAILWAQQGLTPYADYAYFHMPYTVYVYGLSSLAFHNGFLGARFLCGVAAGGVLILIAALVWRFSRGRQTAIRFALAIALPLLVACTPLTLATCGLTWNHDWPALFVLIGIFAALRAIRGKNAYLMVALAGACAGMAGGLRLTFLPIAGAFALAPFFFGGRRWGTKALLCGCAVAGTMVALVPAGAIAAKAPERAWFGNFGYPKLPRVDPTNLRIQKTMRPSAKARFFVKEIVRTNIPLFAMYLVAAGTAAAVCVRGQRMAPELVLAGLLIVFACFGCFAPSRYQYQHFYALVPLLAFGVAASIPHWRRWQVVTLIILGIAAPFAGVWLKRMDARPAWALYAKSLRALVTPERWPAVEWQSEGRLIRELAGPGPVLTLAPILPVLGGNAVYAELVLGPFGWRNAHLLSPEVRRAQLLMAPENLMAKMAERPAAAVLLGYESAILEEALEAYAVAEGMTAVELPDGGRLYTRKGGRR